MLDEGLCEQAHAVSEHAASPRSADSMSVVAARVPHANGRSGNGKSSRNGREFDRVKPLKHSLLCVACFEKRSV